MANNGKGFTSAANEGASVFDQIASGNGQHAENVTGVQDVQNVQNAKNARGVNKKGEPLERLNLKIPAEIKEYLTVAAAKASIEQRRNISLTEYLIQIVREDMAKNNE